MESGISFKLQDKYVKNQADLINIQFSSTKINFSFDQFFKYSQYFKRSNLYIALINEMISKLQEIGEKYHFNSKSVEFFFKLIDDEEVNISNEEYFDLCKLSTLLQVDSLHKYLQEYTKEHSNDIDFLLTMIINQQTTEDFDDNLNFDLSFDIEDILKDNIEKCIINKKFGKLPISTIHRILDKCNEKQNFNDLLYEFIVESIEERYTLFKFVRFQSLSEENFDKLCKNYIDDDEAKTHHYYQYLPIDLLYIKSIRDEKKSLEKQMKMMQDLFKKESSKYENRIKKIEQEKNDLQKQIIKMTNDFNKNQTNMKNEFQTKISKITINNKQLKKQINDIEEEKSEKESQIEKLNSQIIELKKINENLFKREVISFAHIKGQEFKGIINYLTEITGGNIHENGTINLTSTEPTCKTKPEFLLDQTRDYHFNENDIICYDFKDMKIKISSYTIKSMDNSVGHIKNWAIEISDDNKSWTEIDHHRNDPTLNSPGKIATFDVKPNNFSRFCRFRHIGDYWQYKEGIVALSIRINSIEFYGQLKLK